MDGTPGRSAVAEGGLAAGPGDFEAFVREAAPGLLRLAHALTGNPADAEDVAQEALARVGAAWPRLRAGGHVEAYVRRTLVNVFLNERRRRHSERRLVARIAALPAPAGPDPHLDLLEARRLLDTLPPKQRAAVVMRYVADLDDGAIAEALGCSPSTVRSQVARALDALRRLGTEQGRIER
jgi:RNA polymerase sigma-70 factor (sigma-E family)